MNRKRHWFLALAGLLLLVGGIVYFSAFAAFLSRIGVENGSFVRAIELPLEIFGGFLLFLAVFVKRPSKAVKVSLFLLLIVLSILFVWHTPTLKGQVADVFNSWRQRVATTSQTPTAPKLQELALYMLALINKDREAAGLAPVTLGNNMAAQKHAEDMLANYYLSHWGTDGLKPYMRYTLEGGGNYEAENSAYTGWFDKSKDASRFAIIDVEEALRAHEYGMMYDDAKSDWGHRDNILNKWHKKVNIGIAYDKHRLALVQQFEGNYIEFSRLPVISGGILSMAGKATLGTIDSVALYYDPLPQPLTQKQLIEGPHSYSLGEEAGYILPPGYSMRQIDYVQATKWEVIPNGSFVIEANISLLLKRGSGVYTVVIWAGVGNESINLTDFSIFVGAGR